MNAVTTAPASSSRGPRSLASASASAAPEFDPA